MGLPKSSRGGINRNGSAGNLTFITIKLCVCHSVNLCWWLYRSWKPQAHIVSLCQQPSLRVADYLSQAHHVQLLSLLMYIFAHGILGKWRCETMNVSTCGSLCVCVCVCAHACVWGTAEALQGHKLLLTSAFVTIRNSGLIYSRFWSCYLYVEWSPKTVPLKPRASRNPILAIPFSLPCCLILSGTNLLELKLENVAPLEAQLWQSPMNIWARRKRKEVFQSVLPPGRRSKRQGGGECIGQCGILLLRGSESNKRIRRIACKCRDEGSEWGKFGSSNHQHENVQTLLLFSLCFFSSLNSSNHWKYPSVM